MRNTVRVWLLHCLYLTILLPSIKPGYAETLLDTIDKKPTDVRPQDVFAGMSGIIRSSLHPIAGIESDFQLMELAHQLEDSAVPSTIHPPSDFAFAFGVQGGPAGLSHGMATLDRIDIETHRVGAQNHELTEMEGTNVEMHRATTNDSGWAF